MKKILLSLALFLSVATQAFAVKARPGIAHLTLTDGTEVSAQLFGDENFHYYAMLDGTPLKLSTNGKYEKTTQDHLQVKFSAVQAKRAQATRATGIGTSAAYFPHVGSPKALVILVQFQDVKFKSSDPLATFNHYLNAEMGEEAPSADANIFRTEEEYTNYGSVKEYFKEASLGKFTPQFDIIGPVTVSQNSAYYGKNGSQGDGDDENYTKMISEACQLVDSEVNFADYDSDNDGYVDLVYIIYAGYSESISGNSEDCLWPKSGTAYFYQKFDGKSIRRFGINNELNNTPSDTKNGKYYLNGIGLFCHEFSHTMGLPDLYPTNNLTNNNQSPEYWSVMDMGEYTADGYCPTPYSPWERSIMGWIQPIELSATVAQQIKLEPYATNGKSYKIDSDNDSGEYLLVQNIQNEGWYKGLAGYGLLVWRIDYADKDAVNLYDNPNNTQGKPRVMIVPADGTVINSYNKAYTTAEYQTSLENDPYPSYLPGTANIDVNSLTEVQLNSGTLTSRPLYNITKNEETGIVTFDYLKEFPPTSISSAIIDKKNYQETKYYDLEGKKIETPHKGHLYITSQGKKVIY